MYSAQDFEDELLTDLDLPEEVSIPALGITLTLSGDTYTGGEWTLERLFPDLWILQGHHAGCYYENGCLIGTYKPGFYHHDYDLICPTSLSVEDKFANTYTLSGAVSWETYSINLDGYILTRTDLCKWLGDTITISLSDGVSSGTCDVQFVLLYETEESESLFDVPNWTINFYYSNWNVFYYEDGSPVPDPGTSYPKYKASLTSPIGLYDQGLGFGEWEIA